MRYLTAAFPLLVLAGGALAQPVIDSLNAAAYTRSGRVAVTGSAFGAPDGADRVEIGGVPALHTTWTDTRIVAYVPETASPGPADVRVFVDGQESNALPIDVTLREPDGRVRWTFETDFNDQWYRPALAPDGTVYLHGSEGFVYALSPDGGLKWITKTYWFPYVAPTAGPDGTLYVSSVNRTHAIAPDGRVLWEYIDEDSAGMVVSLTPGPDGNLYAAFDSGFGAASFTPGGELLWNNLGDPPMFHLILNSSEMRFGPASRGGDADEQMYAGMVRRGNHHLYGLDLDGNQRWAVPVGPNDRGAEPTIGSDGTIYTPDFIASGFGWVLHALDPSDGSTDWIYDGGFISTCTDLSIAADDTLYYARDVGHLEAFDPHSRSRRWHVFTDGWLEQPILTPDDASLIVAGYDASGGPGFVRAYRAADGAELWHVGLPGGFYPDERIVPTDRARVTPDGRTAYISTVTLSRPAGDPRAVFFAIDLTDGCPADFNGDGGADTLDVLAFLNAWAGGEGSADINGDGSVDTLDVIGFLNLWAAGC